MPQRFVRPLLDHSSASSAIGEEGVIGKMQHTSLQRNATHAVASLPSTVARIIAASAVASGGATKA